jgi:hypothetical protein
MSTESNNPAAQVNVIGPSVEHPVFRGSAVRGWTSGALADDATYSLGSPSTQAAGFYLCWDISDPSDAALFSVTTASGAVTAVDIGPAWGSHTWDDADTDTKLCFYVSSGELILKNRSGSAATLAIAKLAEA